MILKTVFLNWEAGFPVVIIHKKTAEKLGVRAKNRICIEDLKKENKKMFFIADISEKLVKENQIALSYEARERLGLKRKTKLEVNLADSPKSFEFIKKKLNKQELNEKEIYSIIKDVVNNSLSEAEIALFISAMYTRGTSFNETVYLIKALLKTGNKLSLKGKYIVDKHSIGGIPGNRTSPIVVAICAAAGLIIPKTSSRAITSPAGTADVIESIAKIDFKIKEVEKIIKKTNACLLWGGSTGMVPADSRIIQIEKKLKIDPKSQLLASIMSKKLAMKSKYILIDIPYGRGAKVNKKQALELKKDFEKLGRYFKLHLRVSLNKSNEPMGKGVGPVLELNDVIDVLDPKINGPSDLEEKSLKLSGEIFEMVGKSKKNKGYDLAKEILKSGKAFEKFKEIIKAQKGKVEKLEPGKFRKEIFSRKSFKISKIDTKKITSLARIAGCPSDKKAGLEIYVGLGQKIEKKQKLMTIYAESRPRLRKAVRFYKDNKIIQ